MVVYRGFSVQLVDAETKEPFKEFSKDNKHYAEVEPGAEYFIRLQRVAGGTSSIVRSSFTVDGVDLGYHLNHNLVEGQTLQGPETDSTVDSCCVDLGALAWI